VDPGLVYSTFLGGSSQDSAGALALDATGSAVVSGVTISSDFPTTPGAYDTTFDGNSDAFVAKLDPSGSTLLYSTFLGGSESDQAYALGLDATGAAVVSGETFSADFPTTPGASDTTHNGGFDAFVAKLEFCEAASWSNYGSGWPGTLGIPTLTSSGEPKICNQITLSLGNSLGAITPAVFFMGLAQASIPTPFGGVLLVLPAVVFPFVLPAPGADFPVTVTCDTTLCGLSIYLQAWEADAGASDGVSFTPGLELKLGS
jgi:hypothetical protein